MLSVRELMVLEVAGRHYKFEAQRDADARELLGMTPTRFAQVLNALLDRPEALAHDPVTVNRLRRLRAARRSARRCVGQQLEA